MAKYSTNVLFYIFCSVFECCLSDLEAHLRRRVCYEISICAESIPTLRGLLLLVWISIAALVLLLLRHGRGRWSELRNCRDVLWYRVMERRGLCRSGISISWSLHTCGWIQKSKIAFYENLFRGCAGWNLAKLLTTFLISRAPCLHNSGIDRSRLYFGEIPSALSVLSVLVSSCALAPATVTFCQTTTLLIFQHVGLLRDFDNLWCCAVV